MGRNKQGQVKIFLLIGFGFLMASSNALARDDVKVDSYSSKTTQESQKISPQKGFLNNPSPSTKGSFFSSGMGQFDNSMILPLADLRDRAVSLPELCRSSLRNPVDLDTRLNGCPWLRDQIVWETGNGTRISYPDWTPAQKDRLEEFFQALLRGDRDLGIRCPDPVWAMAPMSTNFYLSAEQAFDIYAAHVAHVFYLEATNRVPWSITNLPPAELEELLASYNYHSRIMPSMSYDYPRYIRAGRDFQRPFREYSGNALVCDPRDGYNFIHGETSTLHRNLLGTTEEETLKNITWWVYNNVRHTGSDEYVSRADRAQHAYLRDRLRRRGNSIAVSGCHESSNLFYDLAKSVNIPLKVAGVFPLEPDPSEAGNYGGLIHEGLVFRWARPETKILWHMDLLYAFFGAIFPVEEGDTTRMSSNRTEQKFFDTNWVSPETIQSWGFHYFPELPTVYPGSGYGVHSRGAYEDAPDYGRLAGFWQLGCSGDNDFDLLPSCLLKAFFYEQQFQLSAWNAYLNSYCFDRAGFQADLNYYRPVRPTSFRLPIIRQPSDYLSRATRSVEAYGGCTSLNNLMSDRSRIWGTDTWVDR